ncbi:MAG: NAD(P)-binding protein [Bacteroidota bacterium]
MSKEKGISRGRFLRQLLLGGGLLGGGWWAWNRFGKEAPPREIPGEIVGASAKTGHLLRNGALPPPSRTEETPLLIIGGGVAGLATAWHLQRCHNRQDYLLLELEDRPGGNAAWGQNTISAYPWGAHYLPVPGPEHGDLLDLLRTFGIFRKLADGTEHVDPLYLCHSPKERLLIHGKWQEGLVPKIGLAASEAKQIAEFQAAMAAWSLRKGADERWAFAIPLDESSTDPEILALDALTMDEWMRAQGWDAPALHWYVNYSCRDDYGTPHTQTSAWAGIHYFAARRETLPGVEAGAVLTWPQGNGWLIQEWLKHLRGEIRTGALVTRIENTETGVTADYYDVQKQETVRVKAEKAVYAGPRFALPYLMREVPRGSASTFSYAPWAVANVSVNRRPVGGTGTPLSWDNVSYHSDSLGYVLADHQALDSRRPGKAVLTWYQPLDGASPVEARKAALARSYADWQAMVLADLEQMHPGIREEVTRVDVWLWGHGMIRPVPGMLWGTERANARKPLVNVHFAHSDLSGISIFEEAFYQGKRAAGEVAGDAEGCLG